MLYTETITNILSFIGVASFSASGAMVGIEKGTDIFGIMLLSAVTATGGGVLRDVFLGLAPPKIFIEPTYLFIACLIALVLFMFAYSFSDKYNEKKDFIDKANNIFDALGLGIFVALGTQNAIDLGYFKNPVLSVLIGTITGIGGGVIRDILVLKIPLILRKHIYATAALTGSITFYLLHIFAVKYCYNLIISLLITFTIRILASHYKWNLPTLMNINKE